MKDFKDPKFWASFFATLVPIVIIVGIIASRMLCWNVSETFTFVGALAGPFSALAGFLYIYATFQLQIEDQANQMFFRLFDAYILLRDRTQFYANVHFFDHLVKRGGYTMEELRSIKGDESFNLHKAFIEFWATFPTGWKTLAKDDFDKRGNDYEFIQYRKGFTFDTSTQTEIKFLLQATIDEASFGSYFRSIINLLEYCLEKQKPEFLAILEANQGRDERVLLFYYLALIARKDLRFFIQKNNYLRSVSKKHLLSPSHYSYLYSNNLATPV